MGCFNPNSSDVDMLVVTEKPLTMQQQHSMAQMTVEHSNAPAPIEMSSIARIYLAEWEHPSRYDFHFSEEWRDKLTGELSNGTWQQWGIPQGKDDDLAAHITVTNHRGIVLYGQAIKAVFPDVPPAHYQDAIVGDFYWLLERDLQSEHYGISNMCRVLQFLKTGAVSSKAEGCKWALLNLPQRYHAVIEAALVNYRDDAPMAQDKAAFDSFATYMKGQIESTL
jgi:streptomycin 3"-adenylyltransferase